MLELEKSAFDAEALLANAGLGRTTVKLREKQTFFSQGEAAESIFYLQSGRAKLTVVSKNGKEATITLLRAGEFIGEESLASAGVLHRSTATSIASSTAFKIERKEMLCAIHKDQHVSAIFMKFLITRGMRIQADLIDRLFISSERRLARILLLMAEFGEPDRFEGLIPVIAEESPARMIGTPRSDVRFFLNRFHELGFISYEGRIRVHKTLLKAILDDQLPGDNTAEPAMIDIPRRPSKSAGPSRQAPNS